MMTGTHLIRNIRKIPVPLILVENGGRAISFQKLKICLVAPAGMVMRGIKNTADNPKSTMKGSSFTVILVGVVTQLRRKMVKERN